MGFSMITEVGEQLVEVLRDALVPDVIAHTGSIGLCSPDDHGDYTLGIYLYDINPDDDVPSSGMVNTGLDTQSFPSTFLTLDYMITAYSSSDLKFRAGEEQKILGRVVQALGDKRILPFAVLGIGSSANAKIEMLKLEREEKMRMWTFPETPYKLSLFYRVHPVEITSTRVNSIVRVRDINMLVDEDRVLYETSLVVLPIDDFTGRPVTGSAVSIQLEGEKPAVVKDDGYRIFTNVKNRKPVLISMGGLYEPVRIETDLDARDPEEIMVLRLMPGRAYPLPDGMTSVVIGTGPKRYLQLWTPEGKTFKLSRDYKPEDGREMSLYNPDDESVEGKSFLIRSEKSEELLQVTSRQNKKVMMGAALSGTYSKTDTTLWPVSEVWADDNGDCTLPLQVPYDMEPGTEITVCYKDDDGKSGEFTVTVGKKNRIMLTD
ncbi:MAG: DUF4255 domain-containing protein [Eubacterium sp.]|nr:DUF4255 domain-containing protein [Eubacterium sp.]